MRAKVFGVGWAKTGTTTLAECLHALGFDHMHGPQFDLLDRLIDGDVEAVIEAATAHESFDDWPWPLLYRELDEAFPDARFVLTTRDHATWCSSYKRMLEREGPPDAALRRRRDHLFGVERSDRVAVNVLADRVAAHDEAVRAWFDSTPGRLLVVDWEAGDGWDELCGFLGIEAP